MDQTRPQHWRVQCLGSEAQGVLGTAREQSGPVSLGLCSEVGEGLAQLPLMPTSSPTVLPRAGLRACVLNTRLHVGLKGRWGSGWVSE